MRKSVSFRRILLLTLSAILLSALVTLTLYSVLAPTVIANAKLRELVPRAQFLSEQTSLLLQTDDAELTLPIADLRLLGSHAYVYSYKRELVSDLGRIVSYPFYPDYIVNFDEFLNHVLAGEQLSSIERMTPQPVEELDPIDLLVMGVPVMLGDDVVGAVFLVNQLTELHSMTSSLLSTLWVSVLAVSMLMVPFAYWFSMLITRPIWNMRDAALRLAQGDFSVHLSDTGAGEIADLSRVFNILSERLRQTIAELTQERNQALVIVNSLAEGILAMDSDGNTIQTNPALQNMLQAAGGDKSLPPEVLEDYREVFSKNLPIERRFRLGEIQIYLTITPITHPMYGVTHALGVFHDETEAERLEQTRRDYVANVSHELKTPLTALRAMIEPLYDGLIKTEEKRFATYQIILRETLRLSRLVDDMLELSRLQAGGLALEKTYFDPLPLLHDIASIFAAKANGSGHSLSLITDDAPPEVYGNPDRVEQVLMILLSNAFSYTPVGSHVILRTQSMPDHLRIIVEDNGPGISPEDLPHVFERFYKADKSHSGHTGTGLGLAIARELIKRLQEEITLENRDEGGARFAFTVHFGDEAGEGNGQIQEEN